jgi:pyruvate oxidase
MNSGKTVADSVVDSLSKFGVDYIFGIPGDAINPIIGALSNRGLPKFIVVRHEEAGAMMASAYAKLTGKLGVCIGTAGPGSIHLLNGLYDAKVDHAPVLAITGQVETSKIGTGFSQEIDTYSLFANVSIYNHLMTTSVGADRITTLACRTAILKRGVAHLNIPVDIARLEVIESPSIDEPSMNLTIDKEQAPSKHTIESAARILEDSQKVAFLVGRGGIGHAELIEKLADKLSAVVFTTYPAKGVVPENNPNVIGILSPLSSMSAILAKADALLIVGADPPYPELFPSNAKIIQIDKDVEVIGKRSRVDVSIVGDAGLVLSELEKVARKKQQGDSLLKDAQLQVKQMRDLMKEKIFSSPSSPVSPYAIVKALNEAVDDDSVVCVDSGAVTIFTVSGFEARKHRFLVSGRLGTMGYALPAAIASKLAYPQRQCIALVGDGGFAMTMADLMTATKYRLPIVVVVFNNKEYALVKFEQLLMGLPKFGVDLSNCDYAKYAESCGALGIRVEKSEEIKLALDKAVANTKGPSLVDIVTNPDEIPVFG